MSSWLETKADQIYRLENGRLELLNKKTDASEAEITLLETQAVVSVDGENAAKFLQGQSTADIAGLELGQSTFGAFCNNKGRVFSSFRALRTENAVLLRMSADIAKETVSQLEKYAVFFRVKMSVWETPSVAAASNLTAELLGQLPNGINAMRLINDAWEFFIEPGCASNFLDHLIDQVEFSDESRWHTEQIFAGNTNINQCTAGTYLPHQLNMDKSGAVSFKKGCYTGQEIVARTEYRGQTKRRVFAVSLDATPPDEVHFNLTTTEAPDKSLEVLDRGSKYGKLVTSVFLPVDFPKSGSLLLNDKETNYQIAPLPFSLD